jgi:hypothetical protein
MPRKLEKIGEARNDAAGQPLGHRALGGERDLCDAGPSSVLGEIRLAQEHLVEIADSPATGEATVAGFK